MRRRAAERHQHDPFTEIDWSVPIDESAGHLPVEHLPLYGTGAWEAMGEPDRRRYSRPRARRCSPRGYGLENILIRVVMRYLYGLAPDHPSHRYLLSRRPTSAATLRCSASMWVAPVLIACATAMWQSS